MSSTPSNSMIYYGTGKKIITVILCLLALVYAAPNLMPASVLAPLQASLPRWMPVHPVNLGLDLQGGSYLLLKVDTKAAVRDKLQAALDGARKELQNRKIGYINLAADSALEKPNVSFKLRDMAAQDQMRDVLKAVEPSFDLETDADGNVRFVMSQAALTKYQEQLLGQSIEIVRRRIDESGTKEPIIQRSGADRIMLQLPGVSHPEEIKRLLGQTAKMTFHLVDEAATASGAVQAPAGYMVLPDRDDPNRHVVVERRASMTGESLVDAQASMTQMGSPAVSFRFDTMGARKFADITRQNVGQQFAIVLDNQVLTAPVIREPITGGNGQIDGNFTIATANELALLLRAGALPAPLTVLEERTVGPGLGQDAVNAGKWSGIVGLLLVITFITVTYGRFGVYANIALLINIAMTFAVLSFLGATLTLPGIAGIVLSIGMAVDANVLIYERIREELRAGRTVLSAVDEGYRRAMAAVTDSNLTTVISGLIMFMLGSGPIRGFAVTLTLGIITSIFSAVMITRWMVLSYIRRKRPTTLVI